MGSSVEHYLEKLSTGGFTMRPDLTLGARSVLLQLSNGVGSVTIPDNAVLVGVMPVSSTTIRIGLEAPEAEGTKIGNATFVDTAKGVAVPVTTDFTWFNIPHSSDGSARVLYVRGGTSDQVHVVFPSLK